MIAGSLPRRRRVPLEVGISAGLEQKKYSRRFQLQKFQMKVGKKKKYVFARDIHDWVHFLEEEFTLKLGSIEN